MFESWPSWALALVPVVALALLALIWHRVLVALRGPEPMPYMRIATADGARLALYRHGTPEGPAVILVAGFAASHMYWDFAAPRSTGEHLSVSDYWAQQGFDVWSFDYRGHGRSRTPSLGSSYGFEHLVSEDLRAVVDAVRQMRPDVKTEALHLVGHSMGAIAVLAHLADAPARYARCVLVSAPIALGSSTRVARWIVRNRSIISTWPVVPFGSFARWVPYAYAALQPPFARLFVSPEHTAPMVFLRWTMTALADVSARLAIEIMGWIAHHGARWQKRDVATLLPAIETELLYITSPGDRFAPSEAFQALTARLPAQSRSYTLPASETEPMGNCDMLLGRDALTAVWAPAIAWIRPTRSVA